MQILVPNVRANERDTNRNAPRAIRFGRERLALTVDVFKRSLTTTTSTADSDK